MTQRWMFVFVLSGCVAMIAPALNATSGLQEPIALDGGQVTGTPTIQWTYGVRLFRGIPYAAPPIGNLRWRAPQPVTAWQGVLRADHFSRRVCNCRRTRKAMPGAKATCRSVRTACT